MEFSSHVRGNLHYHFASHLECSEYPEDQFRDICHLDPVYGTLDLTERDTSL